MYVSPQKATFKKSMRGYKARQVDAYIETLCSDFAGAEEDYQSRIVALEKELAELKVQLADAEALREENRLLHEELEGLRSRRFRFARKEKKPDDEEKSPDAVQKAQHRQEQVRHFFGASANVVRFLGRTGRGVTRVLSALPSAPQPSQAAKPQTGAACVTEKEKKKQVRKQKKQNKEKIRTEEKESK